MGIGTFELPKNQNSTYVDMSGWVNVELPEEDGNRIGSKGLERIDDLASPARGEDPHGGRPADNRDTVERIFAVAVRESDSAASAELLRKALKAKQGKPLSEEFKELDFSRQAACNALKDLDSLTGEDLAAFEELSENDLSGKDEVWHARMAKAELVRAHLNDAVKAQENYAKGLVDYCVNKGWPVGHPQREALLQLANRSLSRAEKIKDLWSQLRKAKSAVGDNRFDQALLNRRGFADRIYFDEARHSETLQALKSGQEMSEAFKAADGTDALKDEFSRLNETYGKGGRNISQKHMQTVAANNFINGLKLPENQLVNLSECAMLVVQGGGKAAFDGIVARSPLGSSQNDAMTSESFRQTVKELPANFIAFRESMRRYADALLSAQGKGDPSVKTAKDEVNEKLAELKKSVATVRKVTDAIMDTKDKNGFASLFRDVFGKISGFKPRLDMEVQNLERICTFEGRENTIHLARNDLRELVEGSRRLSPLVEATVWGESGLHDWDLGGLELVGVKELGHGAFNAVKLCTFVKKDGSTVRRVFRADNGARASVANGAIRRFYSDCPKDVSGFSYSQASGEVAFLFDCTDVFPKTTFGTLNGQPGMFLEVAPGKGGSFFRSDRQDVADKDPFKDIQGQLPVEVAGEVARKLNRLQWLDFLTGQIDRHANNLMIGLADDGSVSVKGIDNDECFPELSAGNGLLVFDDFLDFYNQSSKLGFEHGVSFQDAESGKYKAELKPPLDELLNGKFVVDVGKMDLIAQVEFVSAHNNYGFPSQIDAELCRLLKNTDIGAYGEQLHSKTKLNEAQILAAQARLAQVKLKIAELEQDRKVYAEEDWKKVETLKEINASAETVPIGVAIDEYNEFLDERRKAKDLKYATDPYIDVSRKAKAMKAQTDYYAKTGFHQFSGLPEK